MGRAGGPGQSCLALADRRAGKPATLKEQERLRFDYESPDGALPYSPRHRKGLLAAWASWRRAYLQRVRLGRTAPDTPRQAPRRLPAVRDAGRA